ncbi:MAG: transporter substrate-binding domain-containing protein [Clostridiales bacterium]|nr:transporter substrate-binding domain-containing protein [Clostridiales bacterium]
MKKVTKVLAVLCALAMLLVVAGCSGDNYGLVTKGVLTMGTNAEFPPFEYLEGETVVGLDAALMEEVAERLDLTLEIKNMEFNSLDSALNSGKIDLIAAGLTVDATRLETMDFTEGYYTAQQTIIVKADSEIKTKDDLKGKKIGVQQGTTGENEAKALSPDGVSSLANGALAVEALLSDKVDAVIIDNNPAIAYKTQHGDAITLIEGQFEDEEYAVAVKKGNKALLEAVDKALADMKEDGTFDKLVGQFIK